MELLPVAIGFGLAVSLLFSELYGLAAGGMVVPGYIALNLSRPLDVLLTIVAGMATYAIVHALSQTAIIYGKRRTVITILVGYVIGISLNSLSFDAIPIHLTDSLETAAAGTDLSIIGYIIPGLIAIWIDRQGVVETISSLITASVVVRLLLILVYGMELHG